VSPVRYKLGFYIPADAILHSDCREHLKSYILYLMFIFWKCMVQVSVWRPYADLLIEARHCFRHQYMKHATLMLPGLGDSNAI
jgi:uncharacterized protein (DUF2461 family)